MAATARSRQPLPLVKAARLWRDDPDNDRNQRELAEAVDALPPEAPASVATDEVGRILAVLDGALDAFRRLCPLRQALAGYTSGGRLVCFHAGEHPDAEYAITLWASAGNLVVRRHTSKYEDGTQIRALEVLDGGEVVVTLQWPKEPQPAAVEPEWRPADNDEQPSADVTTPAIREALAKPHWTDDKTMTDEERAERERMEAGHA